MSENTKNNTYDNTILKSGIFIHEKIVRIPKIIHQTYKSLEELPEEWQKTPSLWKKYHPEWKYKFWSDKDCDNLILKYPEFLKTYQSYKYVIQKIDLIRLLFIYEYGGLYVDMDIIPQQNLDFLFELNRDIYLVSSSFSGFLTNAIIAGKKKSVFIKKCLREMVIRRKYPSVIYTFTKHSYIMHTTGPWLITDMHAKYKEKISNTILTKVISKSCDVCSEKPCSNYNGLTKILQGSSWLSLDSKILIFLYCNSKKILITIAVLIISLYIAYIYGYK